MGMHKSGRNDVKTPGASTSQEKKLGEYIKRKQEAYGIPVSQRNTEQAGAKLPERPLQPLNRTKKKLTFEEWWDTDDYDFDMSWSQSGIPKTTAHYIWKAAQENM